MAYRSNNRTHGNNTMQATAVVQHCRNYRRVSPVGTICHIPHRHCCRVLWTPHLLLLVMVVVVSIVPNSHGLNGDASLSFDMVNGWKAIEMITRFDDPPNDGYDFCMPGSLDGIGTVLADNGRTLRVLVNAEQYQSASVVELSVDLAEFKAMIQAAINPGRRYNPYFGRRAPSFKPLRQARLAWDRFSFDGGQSFITNTSDYEPDFNRFCSGVVAPPLAFGGNRSFVDEIYMFGEEDDLQGNGRLFVLDTKSRDLYQLSEVMRNATGAPLPMRDAYENVAVIDTKEDGHVALLISCDMGSKTLQLYVGVKGLDGAGNPSDSFLARNGLQYGSLYYLYGFDFPIDDDDNYPPAEGGFTNDITQATKEEKMEDVSTNPNNPVQIVLGIQTLGVYKLDFGLVFSDNAFDPVASNVSVSVLKKTTNGQRNALSDPDNVEWTQATTLSGRDWPDGIIFVCEDLDTEIWIMDSLGYNREKIGSSTSGEGSTGILDISRVVGYAPGSVLLCNNQGAFSSMAVFIHPGANLTCGDGFCDPNRESSALCAQDCGSVCGDGACNGNETQSTCPTDCPLVPQINPVGSSSDACRDEYRVSQSCRVLFGLFPGVIMRRRVLPNCVETCVWPAITSLYEMLRYEFGSCDA
jgi:hypothetical protein